MIVSFKPPSRTATTCSARAFDDPVGQHGASIEEIIDLHVLLRLVAAMLVADEEHGGRNSSSGECGGIMRGWTGQRHAANAQPPGRLHHRHRDGRVNDADSRCRRLPSSKV